jgi:hypothetical protein
LCAFKPENAKEKTASYVRMPLVVTDKEAAKHKNRGGVLNKFVRRSRTLNEEKLPTKERSKPHPRHASQSLEDLVRCAICLEQLIRPTMVIIVPSQVVNNVVNSLQLIR